MITNLNNDRPSLWLINDPAYWIRRSDVPELVYDSLTRNE